jgi:hypothetical protein
MVTAADRGRRQAVVLIFIVYALLIFEGVLRKWLLPSLSQALFFVRDPFVIALYLTAYRHSLVRRPGIFLYLGVGLSLIVLLLGIVQMSTGSAAGESALLLAAYGWRNYFLYLPLPFVIAAVFQPDDQVRFAKLTFLLAVPMATLVVLQYFAPLESPINVGFAADVAQQFRGLSLGIESDHTRPMGTFTSDIGMREFANSALAMLLALWIVPRQSRAVATWQLALATAAVLTCLAFSGSRSAILQAAVVTAAAMVSGLLVRGVGAGRAVVLPAALAVAAVVLYPIVFPESYSTFMARIGNASIAEAESFRYGIFERASYGLFDFVNLVGAAPLVGYGLGLAGNASLVLGVQIHGFTGWAENDWGRHIVDLGPIVGVALIVFRVMLTGWVVTRAIAGARATRNPLPITLLGFFGFELLQGQITGHGTVNGYVWLFAGLCLAAATPRTRPVTALERNASAAPRAPRFANLLR